MAASTSAVSTFSQNEYSGMNYPPKYPSVIERNFQFLPPSFSNPHIRFARHGSGVILLSLAPTHPLLDPSIEKITNIEWAEMKEKGRSRKRQHGSSGPIGGKHRNAPQIDPHALLCNIHTQDGTMFPVHNRDSKMAFIERNERLKTEPELIKLAPDSHGYIAILLEQTNA